MGTDSVHKHKLNESGTVSVLRSVTFYNISEKYSDVQEIAVKHVRA